MESSEAGLTFDPLVLSIRRASLGIKYQRRALQDIGFSTATTSPCVFGPAVLTTLLRLKIGEFLCFSTKLEAAALGKVPQNERLTI